MVNFKKVCLCYHLNISLHKIKQRKLRLLENSRFDDYNTMMIYLIMEDVKLNYFIH